MSRNIDVVRSHSVPVVTPREGRVSRNLSAIPSVRRCMVSRPARGV